MGADELTITNFAERVTKFKAEHHESVFFLDGGQVFDLWFYSRPLSRRWLYRIPWFGPRLLERQYQRVRALWVEMGRPYLTLES